MLSRSCCLCQVLPCIMEVILLKRFRTILLFLQYSAILLCVVQRSLLLTQKGLCLANYRGSCTTLNQRLGVKGLTKPVGKPVAEAAAFHSISSWRAKCSNILRKSDKIKVFIKLTFEAMV